MKEPGLQRTAALSFVLHLTVFLIAFLILKQPNHIITPPPYTVSLISPDVLTGTDKEKDEAVAKEAAEPSTPSETPGKSKEKRAKEKKLVSKKISDLTKKRDIINTLERIRTISLKAGGVQRNNNQKRTSHSGGKGNVSDDDYYSKIMKEIWQQWVWNPDLGRKDLEAVLSVKIYKDGTAIPRIEKSSGNPLFDRSAIKALAKASPLSPPPYEMEIGVRFYP